jgi:co-chaperonin GroES (HSP10)
MKHIKTLRNTSLVKPVIPEPKGIIWNPTKSKPIIQGEVLVKGPDVPVDEYQVGEVIVFGPNSGIRVKVNGERLMIVKHDDVMAKEEE